MITFEQIQRANEGLKAIDVKGKRYVMVNEKVKAFRTLYPEGFIRTDLLSLDSGVAVMQSKVGYYDPEGKEKLLGTGLAFERQDSSFINKTSYIENCETSAIGRALSFLYLGADDSIASAEELVNAIKNQKQEEEKKEEENKRAVELNRRNPNIVNSIPSTDNTVAKAFEGCMTDFMEMYGIVDSQEALKRFNEYRKTLMDMGALPKKEKLQTPEEVEQAFEAIRKNYKPSGERA